VKNDIVPFDGGAYFLTAGKSRRKGAELGLEWSPVPEFGVGGALTLSDNTKITFVGTSVAQLTGHITST